MPLFSDSRIKEIDSSWIKTPFLFKNKKGVLMIGVDWCGYCHNASPEVQNLLNSRVPVYFLDGDKETSKKALQMLKVDSFPQIYTIENNEMKKFEGNRTTFGILEALKKRQKYLLFI